MLLFINRVIDQVFPFFREAENLSENLVSVDVFGQLFWTHRAGKDRNCPREKTIALAEKKILKTYLERRFCCYCYKNFP